MSVMLKSLGLENAPLEVRLQLMEELWESIAREPGAITLTDAQKAELDRRVEEYERNPENAEEWSVVYDRLQNEP
jgi:putative addiction module component (TIGR02574 family)